MSILSIYKGLSLTKHYIAPNTIKFLSINAVLLLIIIKNKRHFYGDIDVQKKVTGEIVASLAAS